MHISIRVFAVLMVMCSGVCSAQNKVVVVPLFGGESSHSHPRMEYLNLSGAAFQPSFTGYDYSVSIRGEVSLGSGTNTGFFVANLSVPQGVTLRSMTMNYNDRNVADNVRVSLNATPYAGTSLITQMAGMGSTGTIGFSQTVVSSIPLLSGIHPINNRNYNYVLELRLRGNAFLRGVVLGYSTGID